MALAPRLEFRQSQQLVMTPQLQQAIKLLQLSNLELAEFVEQQLEENPFLERVAEQETPQPAEAQSQESDADTGSALDLESDGAAERAAEAMDAPSEESDPGAASDVEYKSNEWANVGSGGASLDDERSFGESLSKGVTLWESLTEQLHVATRDPMTLFIGAFLIDLIDEAGYLRDSVEAIADRLGADEGEVERTLQLIQTFEPSGVGARDIKECIAIQLIDQNRFDPTMQAFVENIELLAKGDLKGLVRVTGADEEDIRDMIAEVRALTPKPGYAFGSDPVQVVTPDVIVRKAQDGGWKIELNSETLPRVLVNRVYHAEISKAKCREEDTLFVSEQFANANWLVKSLDQRARTILKVASEIVRQRTLSSFTAFAICGP